MRAWLVTWEWAGDHAAVEEPVVAVLNARTSSERIRQLVEMFYVNAQFDFHERLAYAKQRKTTPYPATYGFLKGYEYMGEIYCGHNPYLYARVVHDVRVVQKEIDGETLCWTEPKKPEVHW